MRVEKFDTGLAKLWIDGVPVEEDALAQVGRIASMPFTFKHVAVMPDCHVGKGATVGTVFASERALIPAAVGVDLGCGMVAQHLALTASDLPDNLSAVRSAIESSIPHGRTDDGGANDRGAWGDVPSAVGQVWDARLRRGYEYLTEQVDSGTKHRRPIHQLGTLGTGNHFVELCLDESDGVWLMLHSGSRGPGNRIASTFIKKAKNEMERWHIHLPDKDLAYLPEGSEHFSDYVNAVGWAQKYAATNRSIMLDAALRSVGIALDREGIRSPETAINCHHNYVEQERHFGKTVWVTRKGAVDASKGRLGIVPGSMGAKSYIVRGLGNPDSFNSCSHGAGRVMSRTAAKRTFNTEDLEAQTVGVECRKDASVVDEIPGAYKRIDDVMAAQSDLVETVHTLKQVLCVKG